MSDQDDFETALKLELLLLDLLFNGPMVIVEVGSLGNPFGSPFDRPPHVHECEPCQFEWSHDTRSLKTDQDYENAHKCPKCGKNVSEVKRYLER
jgi:hypothetical protein